MLRTQEEAWNEGDIDTFMEHYWKSDDLTFSSGGKTTRGWDATLNRYRERYPTREQMGRLTLDGLEITPLGNAAALVLGQWNLERESEPVSGNFSLVVRKFDDRWLIVHDHTSRLTE
jgi:beta-aspartyl-peptidase (threonine type)